MSDSIKISAIKNRVQVGQDISWRSLLILLECKDGQKKVAGLADALGIPKPSVTRAIDRLEGMIDPFLSRTHDENDRRSPWIGVTPAGKKFLKTLLA